MSAPTHSFSVIVVLPPCEISSEDSSVRVAGAASRSPHTLTVRPAPHRGAVMPSERGGGGSVGYAARLNQDADVGESFGLVSFHNIISPKCSPRRRRPWTSLILCP